LDVIPISKDIGDILETIGTWPFFIVIGGFSVWVVGTFLKNITKLKGEGETISLLKRKNSTVVWDCF